MNKYAVTIFMTMLLCFNTMAAEHEIGAGTILRTGNQATPVPVEASTFSMTFALAALALIICSAVFMRMRRRKKNTFPGNLYPKDTNVISELDETLASPMEAHPEPEVVQSETDFSNGQLYSSTATRTFLDAAAGVDPEAATHAAVVTAELIRAVKNTAAKMLAKTSHIASNSENARARGILLNEQLVTAEKHARAAHDFLRQVSEVDSVSDMKHPATSLVWYRSQLDLSISLIASARIDLVVAMASWSAGVKIADAQRAEAEAAIAQQRGFLDDTVRSSQEAGLDIDLN